MAVDDLWYRTEKDSNGERIPTTRHGRGKRYRVRWTDPTGAVKTRLFDKKGEAERFDVDQRGAVQRGDYVDPASRRITFRDYAEQWRAAQPHRPNTAMNTRSRLTKHVYPAMGHRLIGSIRSSDVQGFVIGLALAPSSVRPVFETMRGIFRSAVRDRLIPFSPCEGVKLPELDHVEMTLLTVAQIDKLADVMARPYRALVRAGAWVGLRQGELFGLQVRDIDFLRRTVRVDRQVQVVEGGGTAVFPPKNKTSRRVIPVAQVAVDALAAHLKDHPAGRDDFVFRTPAGGAINRNTFNSGPWADAVKAAGLADVTCHDLRHFYASALIRAGLNPKVVATRLGHADPSITLRTYAHLWPDDEDRSRDAIDALYRPEHDRLKAVP